MVSDENRVTYVVIFGTFENHITPMTDKEGKKTHFRQRRLSLKKRKLK